MTIIKYRIACSFAIHDQKEIPLFQDLALELACRTVASHGGDVRQCLQICRYVYDAYSNRIHNILYDNMIIII